MLQNLETKNSLIELHDSTFTKKKSSYIASNLDENKK